MIASQCIAALLGVTVAAAGAFQPGYAKNYPSGCI